MEKTKKKTGRKSTYTKEVASKICDRLACGESLRSICMDEAMPGMSAVLSWLSKHEEFARQYARAREIQADTLADEILNIADEVSNDYAADENGNERVNQEAIARSRLRVDARKWLASKLKPKVYGEKISQEHSGPDGSSIQFLDLSDAELDKRINKLLCGKVGKS